MKTIIATLIILISSNTLFSQQNEIDKLNSIKNELIIKRNIIKDSIKEIEIRLNYLKNKNKKYNLTSQDYTKTLTRTKAKIKDEPSFSGDVIGYIPNNKVIKVYDYYNNYWLVEKDSIKGYTNELYITVNIDMKKIKKKHDKIEIKEKYGKAIADKIYNQKIWKGMTTEMAKLSIGRPMKINKSTGSWGVNEQWVYKNKYLYFENGKLTSWQD